MGRENLIYVSMTNFDDVTMTNVGDVTTIQSGRVHIQHTEAIAYTHQDLIQIWDKCKHDNRYKILGADTCKNVRKLRLN